MTAPPLANETSATVACAKIPPASSTTGGVRNGAVTFVQPTKQFDAPGAVAPRTRSTYALSKGPPTGPNCGPRAVLAVNRSDRAER